MNQKKTFLLKWRTQISEKGWEAPFRPHQSTFGLRPSGASCAWIGRPAIGLSGNCFNWQLIHINMQSLSRPVIGGKTSTGTIRKHMDQRHSILLVRSKKIVVKCYRVDEPIMFFVFWHVEKGMIWLDPFYIWLKNDSKMCVFCDLYLIQTICQEVIVSTDQK